MYHALLKEKSFSLQKYHETLLKGTLARLYGASKQNVCFNFTFLTDILDLLGPKMYFEQI